MLFTEFRFLIFFAVAFAVHWLLKSKELRKLWLLICSYGFYAAWDYRFLGLILISTLVDYLVGLHLANSEQAESRRVGLTASLICNLGLLAIFKYFDFFVSSGAELLSWLGIGASPAVLNLVIPVGISFYTFQTLSYTIDVYLGRLQPTRKLLDFSLFVAFFPQLVAGPIVRASEFLPQLTQARQWSYIRFRPLLLLFLFGYVKKACIADNFAGFADPLFADPAAFGPLSLWLGSALYAVQIYCDFSGYSDMAIASAGMLGYRLALNFNFPYMATSVTEFWRRWHISLSSWFRDYLYIPLGGNRKGATRTYINLLIVFFLCGLWHGPQWTFVIWGLFHGLYLIVERISGLGRNRASNPFARLYVIGVVLIAWVFFRAPDLSSAGTYIAGMFSPGPAEMQQLTLATGLLVGFALVHVAMFKQLFHRKLRTLPDWGFALSYGAAVAIALPFAATGYRPFIYFQF